MSFADQLRATAREAKDKQKAEFDHFVSMWYTEAHRIAMDAAKRHRLKATLFPVERPSEYEQNWKEVGMAVITQLRADGMKAELTTGRGMPFITMDWSD